MRKAAEIWDFGVRLNEAWFHLADSDNQDRFRISDQLGRSPNSVEIGLRIDLQSRLESGELLAVGIESGPAAHNGAVLIGRHFFCEDARIDWDAASMTSHGLSFQSIRVRPNPDWRDEPIEIADTQAVAAAPDRAPMTAISKPKGRPPLFAILQPIVRELHASGQLSNKSSKQIENIIRDTAQANIPTKFHLGNSPDRKTINKALIAEGLK